MNEDEKAEERWDNEGGHQLNLKKSNGTNINV
ncbi:hypothetical protein BH10ACI1_BH10ACI1_25980 [soil metagenome]